MPHQRTPFVERTVGRVSGRERSEDEVGDGSRETGVDAEGGDDLERGDCHKTN